MGYESMKVQANEEKLQALKNAGEIPQTVELPRKRPEPKFEDEPVRQVEEQPSNLEGDADGYEVGGSGSGSANEPTTSDYRDSTKLEPQMPSGGTKSSPGRKPKNRITGKVVQIRDFPRDLMAIARAEFPNAQNQTDALAAYVYVKSGKTGIEVSDEVKALVKTYEGDKTLQNIEARLEAIESNTFDTKSLLREVWYGILYVIRDRLGMRNHNPDTEKDVQFFERDGIAVLGNTLHAQVIDKQRRDKQREGSSHKYR